MSKRNTVLIVVVVLVVLVIGFLSYRAMNPSNYSVVYMSTGEVYVGKLSTFPDFSLRDSFQLQIVKNATDTNKSGFQLNPIKDAIWAPESMHLVKDNVVFYGKLLPTSKIAETLATK